MIFLCLESTNTYSGYYLNFSAGNITHLMKGYSVTKGQRVVERRINKVVSSLN